MELNHIVGRRTFVELYDAEKHESCWGCEYCYPLFINQHESTRGEPAVIYFE